MEVVNFRLLAHPLNWLIVWAILGIMLIGFGAVHDAINQNNTVSMTGT